MAGRHRSKSARCSCLGDASPGLLTSTLDGAVDGRAPDNEQVGFSAEWYPPLYTWAQYALLVDLYKHYLDIAWKASAW
jgi:hypothetical protein